MKPLRRTLPAFAFLAATTAWAQTSATAETPNVVATVTSVATTLGGNGWHYLTASVHFQNRSKAPVALAGVASKSGASDEKGNRYALLAVRGLGTAAGTNVDPSFALPAGKGADALFEMRWRGERNVEYGVVFDLDLTVREVASLPSGQVRLGPERNLSFRGLRDGLAASPPGAPPLEEHKLDAGPFSAQVVRSKAGTTANRRYRTMDLTLRLTNTSDGPLTLGYESTTSSGTDDAGHNWAYGTAGSHDTSSSGIGLVTSAAADPQLKLAPGESREVRFTMICPMGKEAMGTRLAWSVALQGLETLPGGQVRKARQYSLTFPGLSLGG